MLRVVCFRVKPVGKPDAVVPHVRFDERGWETGLYATAPVLDSTGVRNSRILKNDCRFCYKVICLKGSSGSVESSVLEEAITLKFKAEVFFE